MFGETTGPWKDILISREPKRSEPGRAAPRDDFLLYDGDCIYCRTYARKARIRTHSGERLRFIDGRKAPQLVEELRRDGCDIEDGMILILEGRRYQGAEAMEVLGSLATEPGWVNRLTRWVGSKSERARFLYPWFQRLRRVSLWMAGKSGFRE